MEPETPAASSFKMGEGDDANPHLVFVCVFVCSPSARVTVKAMSCQKCVFVCLSVYTSACMSYTTNVWVMIRVRVCFSYATSLVGKLPSPVCAHINAGVTVCVLGCHNRHTCKTVCLCVCVCD